MAFNAPIFAPRTRGPAEIAEELFGCRISWRDFEEISGRNFEHVCEGDLFDHIDTPVASFDVGDRSREAAEFFRQGFRSYFRTVLRLGSSHPDRRSLALSAEALERFALRKSQSASTKPLSSAIRAPFTTGLTSPDLARLTHSPIPDYRLTMNTQTAKLEITCSIS